jgi:two-component system phosphate regulon sensor histidine kinase PhoR
MTAEQRRGAFSSLLSSTKLGRTGLGLMIVARVVEAHRGKVRIASRPGEGTTITLVFPV